jgi:hypothetical protein
MHHVLTERVCHSNIIRTVLLQGHWMWCKLVSAVRLIFPVRSFPAEVLVGEQLLPVKHWNQAPVKAPRGSAIGIRAFASGSANYPHTWERRQSMLRSQIINASFGGRMGTANRQCQLYACVLSFACTWDVPFMPNVSKSALTAECIQKCTHCQYMRTYG